MLPSFKIRLAVDEDMAEKLFSGKLAGGPVHECS